MSLNKDQIIIIDSDEEIDNSNSNIIKSNQNNNNNINNNNNNIFKRDSNNNSTYINKNTSTNINNKPNNRNHNLNSNNNSRAGQNKQNYSLSKNVTKSNLPKYNSSNIDERRHFLAEVHEKRLGIGESIQCVEIDDDFFSDNNDLNDINNKYVIKEEFNNNNSNNSNNSNKQSVNNSNNKYPTITTTTTTSTTKTSTNTINKNTNNKSTNVNNSNKQPFDYQASLNIRKEIESIRNSKHQSYRDNKLGQKKMYNLNDIEQLRKNQEKEKAIAASMETTITSNQRSAIHTIDNTLLHPEAIGRKALELTNNFRRSKNLQPLIWNQSIYLIGVEHSKNMGDKLVEFGHDGFKERVKKFPIKFKSVGENVAYTNSSDVSENAVNGWINSPGHRKNLLGNFNVCSIGVYKNSEGFWYLTQLFAFQTN